MAIIIIAAWLGFLALLVKIGVLKGWAPWMKASPIVMYAMIQVVFLIPMGFRAPSGPVVIMKHTVQIIPGVSGVVTDVHVTAGAPMKEGDVLFRLDPVIYQTDVDRLEAQLLLAKQAVDRQKEIKKLNPGATTEAEAERTRAEFNQLSAGLAEAQEYLDETIVRAPSDGFVTHTVLRPGARVIGNTTEVMSFVDESEQAVVAQIEQINLRHIKPEQSAEVIFKMYPGQIFDAKVHHVVLATSSGQVDASGFVPEATEIKAQRFWVRLVLTDTSLSFPPGAVGTVAIYTKPGGVTVMFRKIILRMENWINYIKPL